MYKTTEKGNCWVVPNTGEMYQLDHLKPCNIKFQIKLGEKIELVDARVIFSNHCYTKKREKDNNDLIDIEEKKKDGTTEQRVFCIKRWNFSKGLPEIIKNLNYKVCLQGGNKEIIYRLETSKPGQHYEGWYICIKLDYKPSKETKLELWVRSVHYRTNRPNDIRGSATKFCILLTNYLKSKKP